MKVSLIVPVYNVENYIKKCMESIVNQTIKDIEIIIVDDGSKDRSIELVKEFKDDRIKIVSKENGGLSSARNYGMDRANGEYLLFVDSDDWIMNATSLEEMYNVAKKYDADIVVGNAVKYYSENRIEKLYRKEELFKEAVWDNEKFLTEFIESDSMQTPVQFNLYKRSLLNNNNIKFKIGRFHEDQLFTGIIFLAAKKIAIYPKEFYSYLQREGSIMSGTKKEISFKHTVLNCKELEKYYNKLKNMQLRDILLNKLVSQLLYSYSRNNIQEVEKSEIDFLRKNAKSIKNKLKINLFILNKNIYYKLYGYKKL